MAVCSVLGCISVGMHCVSKVIDVGRIKPLKGIIINSASDDK